MIFGRTFMPPTPEPEDPPEVGSEEWRVLTFRRNLFTELGFSEKEALMLTLSDVDWQKARALLKKGCPPEMVVRILL